jgi:hypothetical protein
MYSLLYISNFCHTRLCKSETFKHLLRLNIGSTNFSVMIKRGGCIKLKKWMAGLLALFLLLIMPAGVMASANVKVDMTGYQGNGNYATWEMSFDVAPVLTGGRVLVPFREIAEAIGAKVGWDQKRQTVTVVSPGGQVKLVIGQKSAYRNGGKVTLDVPAQIVKGRTMVPLRLISEALGAEVDWKHENRDRCQ